MFNLSFPPLFSRKLSSAHNWARLVLFVAGLAGALYAQTPAFVAGLGFGPLGPIGKFTTVAFTLMTVLVSVLCLCTEDVLTLQHGALTTLGICVFQMWWFPAIPRINMYVSIALYAFICSILFRK